MIPMRIHMTIYKGEINMQIKKLIAAALSAVVLCTCTALPAAARNTENTGSGSNETGDTYTDGMFVYRYVEGGVELCSVDSTALSVSLPDETDGHMIIGIADSAFYGCTGMESVQLGKYIRTIGSSAFSGCESLRSVTMPESVVSVGKEAFSGCTSLTKLELSPHIKEIPEAMCYMCVQLGEISIPEGVTSIGTEAFFDCFLLKDLTIPESVETVGDYAFGFCNSLTDTALPSSVKKIGSCVYCGCESLTEFTVTKDLNEIGSLCFMGCKSLTSFDVEAGNDTFTVKDGVIYKASDSVLFAYPAGNPATKFTVPEGVTTIYDGSFFSAEHLEEVYFPSTLHFVGAGAFEYCISLKTVVLPEGTEIIYDNAFADCTSLQSVKLPQTLTGIGNYAFYACPSLKKITIPARCKTVGAYAFGYTDGTEKDSSGNYVPVKISGFKQHGGGLSVQTIIWIVIGCAAALLLIFLLVRVIRKNQLTSDEHEAIRNASEGEDAYESIVGDPDDDGDAPAAESEED